MRILGIESSADETAAAVVQDGRRLLSNVVASSLDLHVSYGGIVPEIAARSHIEAIIPVIEQALAEAACGWDDIDAIAVTHGPGLIGSLLIGVLTARLWPSPRTNRYFPSITYWPTATPISLPRLSLPGYQLPRRPPEFPPCLIVSGGHSQLMLYKSHNNYNILGQT